MTATEVGIIRAERDLLDAGDKLAREFQHGASDAVYDALLDLPIHEALPLALHVAMRLNGFQDRTTKRLYDGLVRRMAGGRRAA